MFRRVHPPRDKAHIVATRSYMTYDAQELQDKLERNPYSYLHVINPDAAKTAGIPSGTRAYFEEVRKAYQAFRKRNWLVDSEGLGLAVYRQTTEDAIFTGIITVMELTAFRTGRLKLHESTLADRESLFADYLETVGCHAEPVLAARPAGHAGESQVDSMVDAIAVKEPDLDFTTTDQVRHTVWWVHETQAAALAQELSRTECLYLADGHHRVASSLRLADAHPDRPAKQGLLTMVLPERDLQIRGYHRWVRPMGMPIEDLLSHLKASTAVAQVRPLCNAGEPVPEVDKMGSIHLVHASGCWIVDFVDVGIETTDADRLGNHILAPILGIQEPRTDDRLRYMAGPKGISELQARTLIRPDSCGWVMHPVTTEQLKAISDAGGVFPPKSTWIEPKLRSGLFVYEL
ncbi:MAG: DUF1015 family protein [Flavobacteriales bacterium]